MDLLRSLPLGLYLDQRTWLHRLDPRVKLAWLLSFLAIPILAPPAWRILVVVLLILITVSAAIPLRVWRQQLGWLLGLCGLLFALTAVLPDGMDVRHQPRLPRDDFTVAQPLPVSTPTPGALPPTASTPAPLPQPTSYRYVLFHQGWLLITRRSIDLGIRVSTLVFTLIYSTNLYLLVTSPEEITAGLENWMQPLRHCQVPVTEITLTLTLSLRFIPLVLEEIQNLFRSVRTRAINWRKLGFRGTVRVWLLVVERLLENLLLRAKQIADAMQVRGFTSPNQHRVQWYQLQLRWGDWLALSSLIALWGARMLWGGIA
jgi:energy-coupling factor transport system permease protein